MKKKLVSGLMAGIAALSIASQALAITPDQCKLNAETATGVYNLSIKNGNPVADAQASAARVFIRRIQEDSGHKISSMVDAINECKAGGMGVADLCRRISSFYTSPPC